MDKDNLIIKVGLVFFITSILGYFYELILTFINKGIIFSHVFLKGPWLPIYGFGSLLILSLSKYQNKPLLIFFLSFFITGSLEYLSGLFLLKVLKMRLWDYTGYFLNIDGLVCFLSAFCFGLGGLLVTYIICPLLDEFIKQNNKKTLNTLLLILSSLFSLDLLTKIDSKN